MLEIKNVYKTFLKGTPDANTIFQNFNLQIPKGQFVNIIGSNGSGKTTLLNLISGTSKVDSGQIVYSGKDISKQAEFKRAKIIGRVFQNPALGTAKNLTVIENLSLAANKGKTLNLSKAVNKRDREKYYELLKSLGMGLENRLEQKCESLSGGQRQALALLMACLFEPQILILDEHTAALDPRSANTIMELTRQLVEQYKFTVLMVTHNLNHALQYGDRILMMHQGKILMDESDSTKDKLILDDVLDKFYSISIEVGNGV